MRIVVDINHPAHVHFFKNFIWEMEEQGHQVVVTASQKDLAYTLLQKYGFTYIPLGCYGNSLFKKLMNLPLLDLKMYNVLKKMNPDILVGIGSIRAAHASLLLKKPCVSFEDTEHATEQIRLYLPFATSVCTPSCYRGDIGPKQIRYNGYHELAYLHPNRFTPNPDVLTELGLTEGDPFIIVRFVSWQASHDVGQHGIRDKVGLVKALEQYGRVLITSEGALPPELRAYQIRVSPEKLHDLLYYATLYVGDGGTTASEAAVLGTPAIFISTLYCGYQLDEEKYGLLYLFSDPVSGVKNGLRKAVALLNDPNLKENAYLNRLKLLEDKIDVTEFMVWFVENYPESCHQIKADPEKQYPLATS
jgi:predicted glycosyltransferase